MKYSVIINLTQHDATKEQLTAGVIDLPEEYKKRLKKLLTFDELPSCGEIKKRSEAIGDLVEDFLIDNLSPVKDEVKKILKMNANKRIKEFKKLNIGFMIGGALFLMGVLEDELKYFGTPLYAFTKREVEEVKLPDGKIEKKAVFKHEGFIPVC